MEEGKRLVVFQDNKIRRIWHNEEWYFSVIDIIEALDATSRPRKYWSDLKVKLMEEGFELSDKIGQLKLQAEDGKLRETDCANTKSLFRIIQSIPSRKAEPEIELSTNCRKLKLQIEEDKYYHSFGSLFNKNLLEFGCGL